jgi:hypothetical protein
MIQRAARMPSDVTKRATRRGRRELGFFYDRDDEAKRSDVHEGVPR